MGEGEGLFVWRGSTEGEPFAKFVKLVKRVKTNKSPLQGYSFAVADPATILGLPESIA